MMARKEAVLILLVLATMSLASPMVVAKPSKTTSDFYLKGYVTAFDVEWQHQANNRKVVVHLVEDLMVKDDTDTPVGTMHLDVVQINDIKTNTATVSAKFEITYYSGEKIEGTMTGKLQYPMAGAPPDLDGKFVGHGGMHVMGVIYLIMEGMVSVLILDGYSW